MRAKDSTLAEHIVAPVEVFCLAFRHFLYLFAEVSDLVWVIQFDLLSVCLVDCLLSSIWRNP